MLRWAIAVALAGEAVLALAPAAARPRLGSYVQVTEVEYRLLLSEASVKAGAVHLQQIDGGMDPHDLRVRYGSQASVIALPLLNPGQMHDAVIYMRPGTYHLWCSLPGHWKLGMHAILIVKH
ncbi:MAG: hypothetical protein ABSC56_00865 [Solirubrobacteraceae bacterium]|jgi:hypothetical protein